MKQKIIISSVGILIAISLFFFPVLKLPVLDSTADNYFEEAITKAGVAYATCRIINASVSVAKESTLELEPAGVGVSLAVGQVLDPIDDMTERLSDVIVTAITSLGVQELAYEISVIFAPPIISIFIFVFAVLIWFDDKRIIRFKKIVLKIILITIIARFCLPISSMANNFIQKDFFDDKITSANNELKLNTAELDKLAELSLPEIDGIKKTIENSAALIKQKSIEFKDAIIVTVSNMGDIIKNLLKLTYLYVGVFLIQVIILPLLTFWFLVKIVNTLFQTKIPVILHHPSKTKMKND
jgi:hypothetical protein